MRAIPRAGSGTGRCVRGSRRRGCRAPGPSRSARAWRRPSRRRAGSCSADDAPSHRAGDRGSPAGAAARSSSGSANRDRMCLSSIAFRIHCDGYTARAAHQRRVSKLTTRPAFTLTASAGVVQWQNGSFPSFRRGFDSPHPLAIEGRSPLTARSVGSRIPLEHGRKRCSRLGTTRITCWTCARTASIPS